VPMPDNMKKAECKAYLESKGVAVAPFTSTILIREMV
jgi:hypothetical protein